jgi:hypothetical protein
MHRATAAPRGHFMLHCLRASSELHGASAVTAAICRQEEEIIRTVQAKHSPRRQTEEKTLENK